MPDNPEVEDERPCLHCLMGDLIDEYYGEYGSPGGEADVIDVSEIMTSLAKIVAEITSGSDAVEGRRIVEELSREISKYDAEYREHAENGTSGFDVRHQGVIDRNGNDALALWCRPRPREPGTHTPCSLDSARRMGSLLSQGTTPVRVSNIANDRYSQDGFATAAVAVAAVATIRFWLPSRQ